MEMVIMTRPRNEKYLGRQRGASRARSVGWDGNEAGLMATGIQPLQDRRQLNARKGGTGGKIKRRDDGSR